MNYRNTLILTGAGFGKIMDLPLENEIMKKGLEICRNKKPELIEGIKSKWELIQPEISFSEYYFEELLTKIIYEEQYPKHSNLRGLGILNLKLAILEILVQSLKHPLMRDIPKIYIEFVKIYKDISYFVTLNYDYLIEKILISEKIPWNYGVRFDENSIGFRSDYYVKNESADFPGVFKYLKLHGSFNWHFCWKCGMTRLTELKYFGVSGEDFSNTDRFSQCCGCCFDDSGQPVLQPLIVPPSAIKYYNIRLFLDLWFEFERLLQTVEKFIIIGCSVRDDDTLLIHTIHKLARKNDNLKSIVVVDPDEKIKKKVENITYFNPLCIIRTHT